jgi:membrane fusion protein (multidrug efflux system)
MKSSRFFCGAMALLALTACSKKTETQQEAPPQTYQTIIVSKQQATLEAVYSATIKGTEDVEIKPRIDGYIDAIFVDEGSVVRKGQALFKINSPQSEQTFASAQASLLSAQAQLNTAQVNVDRIRPLAERGIVSETQLLTYENAYRTAQAAVKQAEAMLRSATATIGWTTVTSPVDGVVGVMTYRVGSLVTNSSVMTTVASTDNVYAYFSLNENSLRAFLDKTPGATQKEKIKNLPDVILKLSDETIYPEKGKIETISGVVNVSTGTANFRAEFPNKERQLRSGNSGKIIIPEIIEDAFIIPQKATFAQQDKMLVYKVQGDSAVQTLITVRDMPDGKSYVVTGGLNEGERIVSEGIATLSNGKKISYSNGSDNKELLGENNQ